MNSLISKCRRHRPRYNYGAQRHPHPTPGVCSHQLLFYRSFQGNLLIWGQATGSDSKESTFSAEDLGSIPASRTSPGKGHGNPLQYPCLENSMDRGAWWATVYEVAKSRTWLTLSLFFPLIKPSPDSRAFVNLIFFLNPLSPLELSAPSYRWGAESQPPPLDHSKIWAPGHSAVPAEQDWATDRVISPGRGCVSPSWASVSNLKL